MTDPVVLARLCPQCGTEASGGHYCTSCGTSLAASGQAATGQAGAPGQEIDSENLRDGDGQGWFDQARAALGRLLGKSRS